ncbi:MAG: hypothetical protein RIQ93_1335 [Verrucomicrobiota bacterium]|jgi:peptidoglycan/xylan/chitin deacetylase (PgdA/CDA1 family)
MTLLVLMFHRARAEKHGNPAEMLDAHFGHIASSHRNVMPGEPLTPGRLNICLSFDDGYFDFYATVFPLLKKYDLRALLGIPPFMIRERIDANAECRLAVPSEDAFAHPSLGGFCAWQELDEMGASGHVTIAAHGFTHTRLDVAGVNLATEIDAPQTVLGSRFADPIESFIFPYGRYSERCLQWAKRRYRYVFRIGGALNRSWNGRVLYRIEADRMQSASALFAPTRLASYRARYLWNRLRRR